MLNIWLLKICRRYYVGCRKIWRNEVKLSRLEQSGKGDDIFQSDHEGAEIRYTTDGTAPNSESTLYSEAITLSDTATVKAIAIKNGVSSDATTKVFTKNGSNVGSGGFETGN